VPNKHKIALIGCGVMGTAIGSRLMQVGHAMVAFDLDHSKVAQLEAMGAEPASSAADAARRSETIVLSLNSAGIVRQAVFGEDGVVHGARAGTVIIDMSSIEPVATRQLCADAGDARLKWLDCPLSGGVPKALQGKLTVMAGGDLATFAEAKPILSDLCQNLTLMGPSGSGQTTKLINQVLCALNFVAVAEATRLAVDAGVDAQRIPAALSGGRADSNILQEFMGKMARNDYSPTGRIDNMVKDLLAVQSLAGHTGTAMPMTSLCTEIHRLMVTAGFGPADNAALVRFYDGPKG
jgi:2-hydroxy-3-oxopropionate reductase